MDKFDNQIQAFSHRLTLLRLSKNELAVSAQQLYALVVQKDIQGRGFFTHEQVISLWMQASNLEQKAMKKFLIFHFPVQKISYSLLSRFILSSQDLKFVKQTHQQKKHSELNKKIKQIFNLQLLNYLSFCKISQHMATFVPSVGTKPTKNQFQEYVICKQLVVDIQAVSKALELPQVSKINPSKKSTTDFPSDLGSPQVQNIQKIMKRLSEKVNSFGNQWLV